MRAANVDSASLSLRVEAEESLAGPLFAMVPSAVLRDIVRTVSHSSLFVCREFCSELRTKSGRRVWQG